MTRTGPLSHRRRDPLHARRVRHLPQPEERHRHPDVDRADPARREHQLRGVLQLPRTTSSARYSLCSILTVAAAEAAIGLAILVVFFRNRGSIAVEDVNMMKGEADVLLDSRITRSVFLPLAGFPHRRSPRSCRSARGRARLSRRRSCSSRAVLSWVRLCPCGLRRRRNAGSRWPNGSPRATSWSIGRFRVDTLTAVMLVVVNTVSALVHLYSIGYMHEDPHRPAVLRLSVALHLRDADARDGRQSRPDVLRMGRGRPR